MGVKSERFEGVGGRSPSHNTAPTPAQTPAPAPRPLQRHVHCLADPSVRASGGIGILLRSGRRVLASGWGARGEGKGELVAGAGAARATRCVPFNRQSSPLRPGPPHPPHRYCQAPPSLRSLCSALLLSAFGVANLVSGGVVQAFEGRTGWMPDANRPGRLDLYFYCLAAFSAINTVLFVWPVAVRYRDWAPAAAACEASLGAAALSGLKRRPSTPPPSPRDGALAAWARCMSGVGRVGGRGGVRGTRGSLGHAE